MMLIDSHCHLNDPFFKNILAEVIGRAQKADVSSIIVPSYDNESLERTAEIARSYPHIVFPAYGIHPWFIDERTDWDEMLSFAERDNTVAIGEIGLDFSPGCPPRDIQILWFERQLSLAVDLGLPAIIHCRKAHEAMHGIFLRHKGRIQGVMHSFSGSSEMMKRFLEIGLFISFSGSVTWRTAKKYHGNGAAVPMDRLLVETDAPSIATQTTVASEVEPFHVVEVARKLAELRGVSLEEICRGSTENANRLFGMNS